MRLHRSEGWQATVKVGWSGVLMRMMSSLL
jgi:hypothetical protein